MLKANFGVYDSKGNFVSLDEMLSVFNICCLNAATDCYLLEPRAEQTGTGCPLLYVCEEEVKFIFPDNAQYEELKARMTPATVSADRLPSYIKQLLFDKIVSYFVFENK